LLKYIAAPHLESVSLDGVQEWGILTNFQVIPIMMMI
jgi:hypothetical protein